jgi:hypothetical protein
MNDDTLTIVRNDDESIKITIKDENGDSLIKDGGKFFFTAKNDFKDNDAKAIFTKDVDVEADAEEFFIDLENTETDLPVGTYGCDVQYKNPTGKVKTIFIGKLKVVPDYTIRSNGG